MIEIRYFLSDVTDYYMQRFSAMQFSRWRLSIVIIVNVYVDNSNMLYLRTVVQIGLCQLNYNGTVDKH